MEQAIELWGFLILTFLGVVAPILIILLSVFREGTVRLTTQYENKRAQSEKNLKEQVDKLAKAEEIDPKAVKESIEQLETIKENAERKLSYLNPREQILQLFVPLLLSFCGIIAAILIVTNIYYRGLSILFSLAFFAYGIVRLWRLLDVIIEVRETMRDEKKDADMRIIELLSALEKKEAGHFLANVYITLDDKNIKDDTGPITMSANKKQELKIGIRNVEKRMAKSVEVGFIFPSDFIIEKTNYYSIFTDKKEQVVRYESDSIHADTYLHFRPLIITPLKVGKKEIRTFIKAENIEPIYHKLQVNVRSPLAEIAKAILAKAEGE